MPDPISGECIAKFDKNSREEFRVTVDDFAGRKLINLRVYYKDASGQWKPGNKGVALSVDLYRDLADAVLQLGEWLKSHNLLPSAK
jgi:hypothetical protein